MGFSFLITGWLIGLGVFDDSIGLGLWSACPADARQQADQERRPRRATSSSSLYFRYTLDHKVVGLQYLVGMPIYFFTGGLLAIAIRTELLSPTHHVMSPNTTTHLEVGRDHQYA